MKININILEKSLSRSQKILLTLYRLSGGTKKMIRFEDIAVGVYKNFKSDFQLKGYPEYPDTGDIVHKPLYSDLKKKGYVLSGNKFFSLTDKGIAYAKGLIGGTKSNKENEKSGYVKLTADEHRELERIMATQTFALFHQGKKDEILDIDFYSFFGVTVRTNKFDFLGRVNTVKTAIEAAKTRDTNLYGELSECCEFLLNKFGAITDFINASKGGKR